MVSGKHCRQTVRILPQGGPLVDLSLWLSPLDGENPSGESLRDDPRFHDLERLTEPQVTVVRDERNNPSAQQVQPADWSSVLDVAEELRAKGRDLRLLVLVARALANENRLAGLAEGLGLIAATFERFWDTMHPELRAGAAPHEAALRRTNALAQLQNNEDGVLHDLRHMVFFAPRGVGPITGRDLERGAMNDQAVQSEGASGLNAAERAKLSGEHEQLLNRVRAGCAATADQAPGALAALAADARAASAALEAVDRALNVRTQTEGPAVPDLKRFLDRVLATLERGAGSGAQQAPAATSNGASAEPPGMNGHAAPPGAFVVQGAGGAIPDRLHSRDDVVKCLDLVIAFYDRTEPSSPIPHLVRRVRRMVPMDFLALMEDLAPSGLKEFRALAGVAEAKK